ncbi:MAG: acetolactate synthase large subunit [Myxococcota bacterium]
MGTSPVKGNPMNGAEAAIQTAVRAGVDVCFANPGTTELAWVQALDSVPGIRAILGLFEGVCTGAADGYGRMTDRPALTLLHLGPGFANGIANLHNARRARSPIVNLIGDHASWHLAADAPLTSDITSLANPVSHWVRNNTSAAELASDLAEAWTEAAGSPGRIATLIAPTDYQLGEGQPVEAPPRRATAPIDTERVSSAAKSLRGARQPLLLVGGRALREEGLRAAARVAVSTGARIIGETFPARLERGGDLPPIERLPYFPDQAIEAIAKHDVIVLAGAIAPVSFFGYEGIPSLLAPPNAEIVTLSSPEEDVEGSLQGLADELNESEASPAGAAGPPRPEAPTGALHPGSLGQALAAVQPEGAIVVDEGATSGMPYFLAAAGAPRHTYLGLTGGAIGQGLPCATGAAIGCPDRQVIALQADGSGAYTVQALWTQARAALDVVTLLCSNRAYRILQVELGRAGVAEPGPIAKSLTDLSRPTLDWVSLAEGFGVPAARVETADELNHQLEIGFAESGPRLIELELG